MSDSYNNNISIQKYKPCAGIGCLNKAVAILKVQHINKKGNFCQQCADGLIRMDLAEEISSDIEKEVDQQ